MASIEIELSPKISNPDVPIETRKCAVVDCPNMFPAVGGQNKSRKYCSRRCKTIQHAIGHCSYCKSRPRATNSIYCTGCAPKAQKAMRDYDRRRQDDAIAKGRCIQHGCTQSAAEGVQLCRHHREVKANQRVKRELAVEYAAIANHWHFIQNEVSTYAGMPFFDGWTPARGGSYRAGAYWIAENLGRRPAADYQLHIVDRSLGFVPGNLVWVPQDKHKREEMIYKLLLEVQTLRNSLDKSSGSL